MGEEEDKQKNIILSQYHYNDDDDHTRRKTMGSSTTTLPTDVLEQVLLRLPARTILKFRSACKTFHRITTKPYFVSAHTRRYCCRGDDIIISSLVARNIDRNIFTLNPQPTRKHKHKTSFDTYDNQDLKPKAVLDGLMCFSAHKYFDSGEPTQTLFTLYNPLTRHHSSFLYSARKGEGDAQDVIALYYHAPSDKYKALIRVFHRDRGDSHYVGSFGPNNAVRTVESPSSFSFHSNGRGGFMLIRGNLYGFGWNLGDGAVVVFGTESEQITHHIPLPEGFEYDYTFYKSTKVMEIGGKLCIYKIGFKRMEEKKFVKGKAKLKGKLWVLCDEGQGIWIKKQVVNVEKFKDRGRTYNVVARVTRYNVIILVDPYDEGIASPEKEFTFYYIRDEVSQQYDPIKKIIRTGYKETLASVDTCTDVFSDYN